MTMSDSETKISAICDDIKELLIHKNRKYGNSALNHAEYLVNLQQ